MCGLLCKACILIADSHFRELTRTVAVLSLCALVSDTRPRPIQLEVRTGTQSQDLARPGHGHCQPLRDICWERSRGRAPPCMAAGDSVGFGCMLSRTWCSDGPSSSFGPDKRKF